MNKPKNLRCPNSKKCPYNDCDHRIKHSEFGGCMHVRCKAPGTNNPVCIEVKNE